MFPLAVEHFCGVLRKMRAAPVPAWMLSHEHVAFFVRVHVGDVVAGVVTVGALVNGVVPAVALPGCDSVVAPVLVPVVDVVADNFAAVHADAFVAQFAAHDGGVNACEFLCKVSVVEWCTVMSSGYFFLAHEAVDDLLVVTVLAHVSPHA